MNLANVVATMKLLGADLPAYKLLLEQVLALFDVNDQEALQRSYAEAMAASDAAHQAAQEK